VTEIEWKKSAKIIMTTFAFRDVYYFLYEGNEERGHDFYRNFGRFLYKYLKKFL